MPEVEIDIDDLLDADSEEERALKLRVSSFQNLELASHGCLNGLGSPEPGIHGSYPRVVLAPGVEQCAGRKAEGCWVSAVPHSVSDARAVLDHSQLSNHPTGMSSCSCIFLEEELVLPLGMHLPGEEVMSHSYMRGRGAEPDLGYPGPGLWSHGCGLYHPGNQVPDSIVYNIIKDILLESAHRVAFWYSNGC